LSLLWHVEQQQTTTTMSTQTIITTNGAELHGMSAGMFVHKLGGIYFAAYHSGDGNTMSYGGYRTEGGARRKAAMVAQQSNERIATPIN
jgi:hypothetical protein